MCGEECKRACVYKTNHRNNGENGCERCVCCMLTKRECGKLSIVLDRIHHASALKSFGLASLFIIYKNIRCIHINAFVDYYL